VDRPNGTRFYATVRIVRVGKLAYAFKGGASAHFSFLPGCPQIGYPLTGEFLRERRAGDVTEGSGPVP
jgi:hypothetical protein